jgi:hypothetical protein
MVKLNIRIKGLSKRLFFTPPQNKNTSLPDIVEQQVPDDLDMSETITLVIECAEKNGFQLVPH